MSDPITTIRSLAGQLGLSRTTVSDALRGRGRMAASTRQRVIRNAATAGYQVNPLTATVLAEIRRTRSSAYRGTIAVVDVREESHWPHGPFPLQVIAGARDAASALGFLTEQFTVGNLALSWTRLDSILYSRRIHGVIVLPAWQEPDLSVLDWSRYAGIYTDHRIVPPGLHSVCTDHYGSMMALLELLRRRGYRRIGLMLDTGRDERIYYAQSAAFTAFHRAQGIAAPVPTLITENYPPRYEDEFAPWFRRHHPDVVLSHFAETLAWIKRCRLRTVETGFVILNVIEKIVPCAGLDLQPRVIGRRAAELVVGQLLRNELGVPACPSRTTILARWVEGPTVRPGALYPQAVSRLPGLGTWK